MAKFGEGDKRWIVEDRADGTNVHNWHWAEKDCLPWSKIRLSKLLENIQILNGEGNLWIQTTTVESVTGEAYVNIRKGKIIPGYEISVRLSWSGEARDGSGNSLVKVVGSVDLPYIADENADEEPDLKVTVKDESPVGQRLREAFLAKGKPVVLKKVAQFVKDMAAGGPAKEELEGKATSKTSVEKTATRKASTGQESVKVPVSPATKPKEEGFKTISLTERFHCRPKDVYGVLLDENRWKGFTQSAAKISKEVGGSFSIFDGAVTGINVQLEEDKLIVQKWRFTSWADGHYSNVCLTFEEPDIGVTIVKLTQTDVPEEDRTFSMSKTVLNLVVAKFKSLGKGQLPHAPGLATGRDLYGNSTVVENTQKGWRDLIFHKIRAVFGYGI